MLMLQHGIKIISRCVLFLTKFLQYLEYESFSKESNLVSPLRKLKQFYKGKCVQRVDWNDD